MITGLYRYPIKGLSAEPLKFISLEAGKGVPLDREFALALPSTPFDETRPRAFPKTNFLMLMKNEALASFSTHYNESQHQLDICNKAGDILVTADLSLEDGISRIEDFFYKAFSEVLSAPPKLVKAEGHKFTDVSVVSKSMMQAVSLINLASIRDLERMTGQVIHPMRFRANIYFDNGIPWSEFEWIGKNFQLGSVSVSGVKRTQRCPATDVNPNTAKRDINIPFELKSHLGHMDMGIYIDVQTAGIINVGDKLSLE